MHTPVLLNEVVKALKPEPGEFIIDGTLGSGGHAKAILEEIEKIRNSEFEPTPGWHCQYCDFKDICDYAQK